MLREKSSWKVEKSGKKKVSKKLFIDKSGESNIDMHHQEIYMHFDIGDNKVYHQPFHNKPSNKLKLFK